jgi:hypothetical protein
MRGRFAHVAIAVGSLALAAGCTSGGGGTGEFRAAPAATSAAPFQSASPEASPTPTADPEPVRSIPPAAAAGGMCRQLDYAGVQRAIGVRFGVAVATGAPGREQVCALQRVGVTGPDLTLALAPAGLDAESFKLDYTPNDGKPVAGLGLAAYTQVTPGGQGAGPAAEVGWLTKKAVYTLTYTTVPGTAATVATTALPGLIQVAKAVH